MYVFEMEWSYGCEVYRCETIEEAKEYAGWLADQVGEPVYASTETFGFAVYPKRKMR